MKPVRSLLACALLSAPAHAAVLVHYDFEGFTPGTSTSTGTLAATAYNTISFGSGVEAPRIQSTATNPSGSPAPNLWSGWDGNMIRSRHSAGTSNPTSADAVVNNAFIAFTYSPSSSVALNTLALEAAVRVDLSGVGLAAGFTLRSSLTGTANLGSYAPVDAGVEFSNHDDISFDLSGVGALQDLSTPVTFYLYVDGQGSTGRREIFVDNIILSGDAVPEPASAGLAALGMAGLLVMRRRAI